MPNDNLEIPAEVREFAEKTVDQARKAFDSFVAAAQKASAQSEVAAETFAASAQEASTKAITFAEANVKAAFDLAEKLVRARDPKEFLAIQSEFLKSQVSSVQEQAKQLGAEGVLMHLGVALPGKTTIKPSKPTRTNK